MDVLNKFNVNRTMGKIVNHQTKKSQIFISLAKMSEQSVVLAKIYANFQRLGIFKEESKYSVTQAIHISDKAVTNATAKISKIVPKISILHKKIPKSMVVQHKIGAQW